MGTKRINDIVSMSKFLKTIINYNHSIECRQKYFGKNKRQYYLYFKPKGEAQKKIIVYIHGGSWSMFSPNNFKYIGEWFASKGYHTISLGYRHTPKYKCPDLVGDVFSGLKSAISELKHSGIDTEEIIIIGSSAGGHLGGVLSYDKKKLEQYGINQSSIKAFISIGGILSFEGNHTSYTKKIVGKLFEKQYDRRIAEPYYLATGKEKIKVLCLHSKNDPIVSYENTERFCDKINSCTKDMCEIFFADEKEYLHSNLVAGIFANIAPDSSLPIKKIHDFIRQV